MAGQQSNGSGGLRNGGTTVKPKTKKPKTPPIDPGRQTPTDGFGSRPQPTETPAPAAG